MPNADLAAQRALLKLADTDRRADSAAHQRAALPELGVIADGSKRAVELREKVALGDAEIGDIDSAGRKLDGEIESVRSRAARDEDRLASGSASPKEMESLQREVESLARRQASLEDDSLELMERRENADAGVNAVRGELTALTREIDAATVRRNDQWSDIDDELSRLALQRAVVAQAIPDDVMAIYERMRGAGKVAAAAMRGEQCGGCGMSLDRASLEEIRSAAADFVSRCPECSTLLVRNS
ncbi:MAG: C4-type zinc ribbon domain-containing protein [Nakamurella sp.]